MATKVKCALCPKEYDVGSSRIKRCPKDEFWVCHDHASTKCPRCGTYLK